MDATVRKAIRLPEDVRERALKTREEELAALKAENNAPGGESVVRP
jgi:hypothetical protein